MSKSAAYILIAVLAVVTLFLGAKYLEQKSELKELRQETAMVEESNETEAFLKLFIDKVLGANGEVSFEDRLKLETEVRDLDNPAILDAWNAFVGSQTSDEAQSNLRALITITVQNL